MIWLINLASQEETMKLKTRFLIKTFLATIFLMFYSPLIFSAEKVCRAGAATSDITSPLGSKIVGGFVPFPSTRVHDQLNARCLVLDDGSTKLALVVLDLLGIARHVSDEA